MRRSRAARVVPAGRGRHLRSSRGRSGAAASRGLPLAVALAVLVGAVGVGGIEDLAFGPSGAGQPGPGAGPGPGGVVVGSGSAADGLAPRVGVTGHGTADGGVSDGGVSDGWFSDGGVGVGRERSHGVDADGVSAQPGIVGHGAVDPGTDGTGAAGPLSMPVTASAVGMQVGSRDGPETGSVSTVAPAGARPPCVVVQAPRSLGLSSYYEKACVVQGVPVVASAVVADAALVAAARVVAGMLRNRPDLMAELVARRFRLGIIGVGQRAIELPEYRDLPVSYPQTDWDAARAYGATPSRPLAAVPEENLLCLPEDTYPGQSVLAHELGHSVLDMAVLPNNPAFEDRLRVAFRAAAGNPSYRNTYAMTNVDEYWGEGVQDFFDASREVHGPGGGGDGYDGPIFSRATLREHDPVLYALIAEVFTEVPWRPTCP